VLNRFRVHANYANTMATIAVMIALGGTSYAALTLPRNSVGDRQIRAGAVRGSEVKNGSLSAKELSAGARNALRGTAGPAGSQGPAGHAATPYFAAVASTGERTAGNATSGGATGSPGNVVLGFDRSMVGCAVTATLGTTDATTTAAGRVTVNIVSGQIGVQTYGTDGSPTNLPFHVIAAC
jgi:hypothetical protein